MVTAFIGLLIVFLTWLFSGAIGREVRKDTLFMAAAVLVIGVSWHALKRLDRKQGW